MIYYLNKEIVKLMKRIFPIKEVKYEDINFIAIDCGCPYSGVIIKEVEEIKEE